MRKYPTDVETRRVVVGMFDGRVGWARWVKKICEATKARRGAVEKKNVFAKPKLLEIG